MIQNRDKEREILAKKAEIETPDTSIIVWENEDKELMITMSAKILFKIIKEL